MISRPVWAEIDRAAIRANVAAIQKMLSPGCAYMAVVKANAYGHGDTIVAEAAAEAGAAWFGVILPSEAENVREAGVDAPVLLLHELSPLRVDDVFIHDLTPTVITPAGVEALQAMAERHGTTISIHLKVETGLNRLGIPPEQLDAVVGALAKARRLDVQGVYSHFAVADPPDDPSIAMQLQRFDDACSRLAKLGVTPSMRHIGNSATALTHPEAHFDMVRVGISTYGIAPAPSQRDIVPLHPAMTLKAKVAMAKRVAAGEGLSYGLQYRLTKPSWIATLPLGYADGWPRHATGKTFALIHGKRYPIVGTICMDAFMVDCGDDEVAIGDVAVLIGAQGDDRITADEVASSLGTIPYEIVTQISRRVDRIGV